MYFCDCNADSLQSTVSEVAATEALLSAGMDTALAACPRSCATYRTARAALQRLLHVEAAWLGANTSAAQVDAGSQRRSQLKTATLLYADDAATQTADEPADAILHASLHARHSANGVASGQERKIDSAASRQVLGAGHDETHAVVAVCECGRSQLVVPRPAPCRTVSGRPRCVHQMQSALHDCDEPVASAARIEATRPGDKEACASGGEPAAVSTVEALRCPARYEAWCAGCGRESRQARTCGSTSQRRCSQTVSTSSTSTCKASAGHSRRATPRAATAPSKGTGARSPRCATRRARARGPSLRARSSRKTSRPMRLWTRGARAARASWGARRWLPRGVTTWGRLRSGRALPHCRRVPTA